MRVLLLVPTADPPTLKGERWSAAFKEFVSLCLQMDAGSRPSAKELLRHRWIRGARKSASLLDLVRHTLASELSTRTGAGVRSLGST